jgi:hypothetical protein
MTFYVIYPGTDTFFAVEDGACIIQESELTEEENEVLYDGLVPQSVLDKATDLEPIINYYMGIPK